MNDILFLSAVCSDNEYSHLIEKYNTCVSHAGQKHGTLLCDGLKKQGYNIKYISRTHLTSSIAEKRYFKWRKDGDFTYISRLNVPVIGNIFAIFSAIKHIRQWQKSSGGGTVICETLSGELSLGLILSRIKSKKIALVTDIPLHMAEKRKDPLKKLTGLLKEKIIGKYDGYILLTEQMNEVVNRHKKPFIVIEGIVDEDLKNIKAPEKYKERVCLFAGLLHKVYGIDKLIDGFLQANIDNTQLHIYGYGDYEQEIKKAVKNNSRIKFFGEKPNSYVVEQEMKATLLINPRPTNEEFTKYSCPSKNLEYMASGTPLLTTDLSGVPSEYKKYTYIIKDQSSQGIAEALKDVLQKPDKELEEFGKQAQNWVIDNKNQFTQAEKIKFLIQTVGELYNGKD